MVVVLPRMNSFTMSSTTTKYIEENIASATSMQNVHDRFPWNMGLTKVTPPKIPTMNTYSEHGNKTVIHVAVDKAVHVSAICKWRHGPAIYYPCIEYQLNLQDSFQWIFWRNIFLIEGVLSHVPVTALAPKNTAMRVSLLGGRNRNKKNLYYR